MRTRVRESPRSQFLVWFTVMAMAGGAAFLVIGATYPEFMDCSNPEIHVSAHTKFSWALAILASATPAILAIWLAGGPWKKLPALAVTTAVVNMTIWWWMLDANCEWYGELPV